MSVIAGIHPVEEALNSGRPIERVMVARGAGGTRLQKIIDAARRNSIPLRFENRQALDRLSPGATHQGVIALAGARPYNSLEDVVSGARMMLLLDGVTDPHNLGAIIRTAHAAGADAVVVPERRAAPVTETVVKAASGALEHLPLVRVVNINRTIEELKKRGFWIYGLDERGDQTYDAVEFQSPSGLVLGSEGGGLHEQVKKHCDFLVRIPLAGKISSLNVSVAAGIVLFEWKRRTR